MRKKLPLPTVFCWTRFGTEAGETIDSILDRKEHERRETDGVYFWGIGNSIAPGVVELLRRTSSPEVLFSPIRARPRAVDVDPPVVVHWCGGVTLSGAQIALPPSARVTSGPSKTAHYALVCASEEPLRLDNLGRLEFDALRNLGSGNPLGSSQVTAVVERLDDHVGGRDYVVALRSRLVAPYFVRLVDPVVEQVAAHDERARAA